jgi:hypothetical protein
MKPIKLPRSTAPGAVAEAESLFKAALEDPLTVLMVVYGDEPDTKEILKVCSDAASVKPDIRQVVWVPDPTVLTDELKAKYWRPPCAAVSIGLDDEIAKELTSARAKVDIYVEQAFLYAESQGGA